jgi:hypothetical protein
MTRLEPADGKTVCATLILKRAGLLFAIVALAHASSPSVWEMSSFNDFIKGAFDGVSLGRDGRLSLAPKLDTFFTSEQPVIWSVAAAGDGTLYAATGHRGRVFRIEPGGASKLLWTADRPEVFAIAVARSGAVYAASSPDGKIYRIDASGNATEYFNPKTKYIWSLALADDGTLYAGTSDDGRVYRVTAAGQGEVYYTTGQGNVTGLMLDRQGRLLAGTEPNGILYRITAKDKAFALYDSSLPEIRAVAPNADGSIFAVALGGSLARKTQTSTSSQPGQTDGTPTVTTSITVTADAGGDIKPAPPTPTKPQEQVPASAVQTQAAATSSSTDSSTPVEKSAIYRINADNTVDTLWSSKEENVYDILPSPDGQVYFSTDASGRIYRLGADRKLTLVSQTNEAEATRLLQWRGAVLAATGNMGKIYRLGASSSAGTYESPVFDAGGVAQWGKLRWQGENGAGTISFRTRSGNSLRPDATWSDWSSPMSDASGAQIASPNARYLQYEAKLSGTGVSLENVSAAWLAQNNPPVVKSVTVMTSVTQAQSAGKTNSTSSTATTPYSVTVTDTGDAAPTSSTGTPTQTLSRAGQQQLIISWQAEDPEGDKLVYEVDFRGEGMRGWIVLKKDLHDNMYTIDGNSLADGRYFFRVVASDREVNPPASAKEAELVSSPVLIDNTPPRVRLISATRSDIAFDVEDDISAIRSVEYAIDGGPWTPIAPVDGILDSKSESFRLHLPALPDGEHLFVARVADSGGNMGLLRKVLP